MEYSCRIGAVAFLVVMFSAGVVLAGDDYRCTIERVSLAGGDSGVLMNFIKKIT